ncbi:MAG: hypothetical protein GQ532_11815 [Methylomarinum sp.]|nr:hypothetical protein [Methylomarinum sp.]
MSESNNEVDFMPDFTSPKIAQEVAEAINDETTRDKVFDKLKPEEQALAATLAADNDMGKDDPAWVIIHALSVISEAPEIAKNNVAKAIASEISKSRLEFEKINIEAQTAAAQITINTIRAIDIAIDKPIQKFSKKIEKSMQEIEPESELKWLIIGGMMLIFSISAGYFMGSNSVYYQQNLQNEQKAIKYENINKQWLKATDTEKKAFNSMMKREIR